MSDWKYWIVADSLYCDEAFFCSHLDSYSHYLRVAGKDAAAARLFPGGGWEWMVPPEINGGPRFLLALDQYDVAAHMWDDAIKIAQIAAVCSPMPWEVRKPDGSPAYSLVLSSIPWMVEAARAAGCRAEYQALAFDTRARVCGMGVKRDIPVLFCGSRSGSHVKREAVLRELGDLVTVAPPTFGRDYFRLLARAKVVVNPHAEWSRGTANNMRCFESIGLGAAMVSDGFWPEEFGSWIGFMETDGPGGWRDRVEEALAERGQELAEEDTMTVLLEHTYESRIPRLVELARSL
jgi:hypothetical protein